MSGLNKALIFLFALMLASEFTFCQSFLPVCKNYGTQDYTESAEFRCAVADGRGTLYFGTNYGVLIYKGEKRSAGKNWEIMLLPEPDVVQSLYLDTANNRLYAGTGHGFGYFQLTSYNDGVFNWLSKDLKNYSESLETWHIFAHKENIIFHTTKALFIYNAEGLKNINAPEGGMFHNIFPAETGFAVNALENGWFFYDGKLTKLAGNNLPSDRCYALVPQPQKNNYLAVFRNAGIVKFELSGGTVKDLKKISSPKLDVVLATSQIYGAISGNNNKNLVLATLINGALILENSEELDTRNILSETSTATNILSSYGLFKDPLQNIWILGKSNLSCLPSDLSLLQKDLKGITVKGVCNAQGGVFCAASNGLYFLKAGEIKKLAEGDFKYLVNCSDTAYATDGARLYSVINGKVSITSSPNPINHLTVINKTLWVSCVGALYLGAEQVKRNARLMETENVLQAVGYGDNAYLLFAENGVAKCDLSGQELQRYELNKDLSTTQNARLFATSDGVVISNLKSTFVLSKGKIEPVSAEKGTRYWLYKTLSNDATVTFEYGHMDVTSLRIKEKYGDFVNANCFMSLTEVFDACFFEGNYYLATKTGLFVSPLVSAKPTERIFFYRLSADTLEFTCNGAIEIPYENGHSINVYSALNSFYSSFDNTQFSYRLSNYNENWTGQYQSNFSFNNLSWGEYTLDVIANYGNNQESPTATLRFTILKPWWATWWGISLWILLFLLFIYIVVQVSVYRLKKSKIKLEGIVKERTREIVEQKEEIEHQKEEIEHKNLEITDSINYAQRIQNSLLKGESKLTASLPGSFVLYMPKDIVSGDFYWFADVLNYHVVAVADCTGHGVPGAFMSMLGVAKLNELAAKNIFMPHELLHELNHLIVETLGQNTANSDSRDGMDAAIICIDKKNNKLYYAGANRPLIILNKETKSLTEIKATKLPVGGGQYGEHRDYELHQVTLDAPLAVFLCTDGYADQFGGPKGKKFMSHRLQDSFKEICGLPAHLQKQKLADNYLAWKGKLEQVDDVCLIGLTF